MIKLTVQAESGSTFYSFEKKVIMIGSGSAPEVDLSIPGFLALQLKIVNEDGLFIITNCANDPFITLNSFAFGKKILQDKDTIHIGKVVITIDILEHSHTQSPPLENTSSYKSLDIEKELNSLEQELDEDILGEALNIKSLMDEVKQFDYPEEQEEIAKPQTAPVKNSKSDPTHPKEKIQAEVQDEQASSKKERVPEKKHFPPKTIPVKKGNWRFVLTLTLAALLFLTSLSAWGYIHLAEKASHQEILAAQSVSDIAMALTYAQLNHIKPQMQNWSDPHFLKEQLSFVIPENVTFLTQVDNHGHLTNCRYILRIYSNKDFSRFVVSALPAPSILQWLIPKHAILVDSQSMELRKIHDLRDLNRLLVNPNILENQNGMEISALVKQGTLLPLHALASKSGNPSFLPPHLLSSIHPGAESYIYNAPRYYPFAESFAKRAVSLINATENATQELRNLQEEILDLAKLPHLIIYSSTGEAFAAQSKKAIRTFMPDAKFLTAYFHQDHKGEIAETKLLLDNEPYEQKESEFHIKPHSLHPEVNSPILKASAETHPLKFQLQALATSRKQILDPLTIKMIELLNKNTSSYQDNFEEEFNFLLRQYLQIDHQESEKIAAEIHTLYDSYSTTPIADVLPFTQAAGLEQIANASLKIQKANNLTGEQFDYLLLSIQSAKEISELAEAVTNATSYVRFKHIPDANTLITYQKRVRLEVTKKLDTFLLSPHFPLSPTELTPEKRKTLAKILELSWITDPEEQLYYLSEFDELSKLVS